MKKVLSIVLIISLLLVGLVGCGGNDESAKKINVVSREQGSGTRSAFVELTGVEEKDDAGNKTDKTTLEASIVNKTDVMLTTVANDPNAIGYASLGSVNDTVKMIKVDGVSPTVESIQKGEYPIARPFYIVTKGEKNELVADFIDFILSSEGQEIAADGYIPIEVEVADYKSDNSEGKLVIAGSSSVTPLMEKLVEKYKTLNQNANIEVQMSDSTAGVNETIDGNVDIGMVSRNLKENEEKELEGTVIAMDGIAVIVNPENKVDDLSLDGLRKIFLGEIENWDFN